MKKRKQSQFFKEFKEFISKGSVIDLAVGVVVGGAFTTIVNTLVSSVLTPLINFVIYLICGGNSDVFNGLDVTLIPATLDAEGNVVKAATVLGFSNLITAILNFLLIAFTLFCIIKGLNRIRKEAEEANKRFEEKVKTRIAKKLSKEELEEVKDEIKEEVKEELEESKEENK